MDLDNIRVFTHVVQAGSFTAAAKLLGLPKSTVSRRVNALEAALGARLLHRTTRRVRTTDVGDAYYARISHAMEDLEEAQRVVSELQDKPRGLLRVTAPVDFAVARLVDVVHSFERRYPEVSVHLNATGRVVDLVAEGYDLALRAGALTDSSLVARRLVDTQLSLYASRAYLDRRGRPQSLADLAQHDCLVFGDSPHGRWNLTGPEGPVEVRVSGRFSCNDVGVMRMAVIQAMGIGQVPDLELREREAELGLERVLPAYSGPSGNLHAVYPSARHLSPKVRAFIDHASEQLKGSWHASRQGK